MLALVFKTTIQNSTTSSSTDCQSASHKIFFFLDTKIPGAFLRILLIFPGTLAYTDNGIFRDGPEKSEISIFFLFQ